MKKLIAVFAHPDDETYMAGGTIAKYVKAGWRVDLLSATKGEVNSHSSEPEVKIEPLGVIHARELEEAAGYLGIRSITFLDYKDGKLNTLSPGEIEDKLMTIFRDERPDVVITFEPGGVTNDPDHAKVSLATTFAFQKYADDRHEESPDDENPPKLYFACQPESSISYLQKIRSYPTEANGKPLKGIEDKKITTVIDISRSASSKVKALRAFASEQNEVESYLAIDNNPFLKQEYFVQRYIGINEVFVGKNDRVSDRL